MVQWSWLVDAMLNKPAFVAPSNWICGSYSHCICGSFRLDLWPLLRLDLWLFQIGFVDKSNFISFQTYEWFPIAKYVKLNSIQNIGPKSSTGKSTKWTKPNCILRLLHWQPSKIPDQGTIIWYIVRKMLVLVKLSFWKSVVTWSGSDR